MSGVGATWLFVVEEEFGVQRCLTSPDTDTSSQGHEAGRRRPEAARIQIETRKLVVEVDVEPLTSRGPRLSCCDSHKSCAYSLPRHSGADDRVDDERVDPTVPRHIDEADQLAVISGDHPAETVRLHLFLQSTSRIG